MVVCGAYGCPQRENVTVELDQAGLQSLYDNMELIQEQLDTLSST